MAVVEIAVEDFSESKVPPVCVFSGVPSENVFRFRFDGVTGGLPVNAHVLASLGRLRKVVLALAAASVVCFSLAVGSGSSVPAFLALGFMLVALGTTFTARRKLVRGTVMGNRLRLANVHPAFVDAVIDPPPQKCSTCPTLADCKGRTAEAPSDCVDAR